MSLPKIPVHLRFWDKVNKTESCWLWTRATAKGYGRIGGPVSGKPLQAHVVSWEMANGKVPAGMYVCHHCDVRNCVRPDHLFLGTPKDNVHDMIRKGRKVSVGGKGAKNAKAKLTNEDIIFIRKHYRPYSRKYGGPAIGRMFSITSAQINTIIHNKQWRHI